ncbi:MAG TPA: dihydrofolate reductase family protein [Anaerolineae bacterium]|nr:dihydrofolate reductase family protein [Anaerolineae bacterium]
MRKVVLFMHISLDGFAAGPNGELDWISYDEELEKYAEGVVSTVGAPLYGRVTYQMMESYWPTVLTNPSSTKHEIDHANWVENIPKVVFSKTLEKVEWNNTRLIKDNIAEEVLKLKQQPGKDLVIFGSPGLTHTFMELDLIDEYRLTVNPVILGQGMPVFKDFKDPSDLKLLNAKTFDSGVVALHYETKRS